MLHLLKQAFYRGARLSGPTNALLHSRWRSENLLVLCYHGVSLDDEHRWCPLYMKQALFRARLQAIRDAGCNVLSLTEGIERMYNGTLPPSSVVITFDDGFYDFYSVAWPVLREFGFPVTVYLTTYYSLYNVPVFDPMCSYLFWKAQGRTFDWPELDVAPVLVDAQSSDGLVRRVKSFCLDRRLSGREKDTVLRELAGRLGVDYDDLCRRRLLHIMNPAEAKDLSHQGVDFQLHCHRHRVYRSRERFQQELRDNQQVIAALTGQVASHFCYPGGCMLPEFPEWLADMGIQSATTTQMDIASPAHDRYTLPRLLDKPSLSNDEFCAWLSGLPHFLPKSYCPPAEGQLDETPVAPVAA